MPPCNPLLLITGTVTKIFHTFAMKPKPSTKTFRLLALLLVLTPLIAGCWFDNELPSGDNRTGGGTLRGSSDPLTSGSTPPGRSSTANSSNKIQIIDVQGQPPGLQFGGTRFQLVTRNDLVNQYIPVSQTLDNWQAMFVVRRFPELSSPQEAIDNVVDNLVQQGADRSLISIKKGGQPENELAIDFIIWTEDKSLTEFNIHVYRRMEGGMIANMYLMRGYGVEGHSSLSAAIATQRELLLQSVLDSQFPIFVQ